MYRRGTCFDACGSLLFISSESDPISWYSPSSFSRTESLSRGPLSLKYAELEGVGLIEGGRNAKEQRLQWMGVESKSLKEV